MSIDVEDYWSIFFRDWLNIQAEPSEAVVKNTEWFLETLAGHDVKATFFILGEVAEKFPSLVKRIAENGHEVGVHGFYHKQVFKLTEEQFRSEVGNCKKLLEDIISDRVAGHRAAAFSIMPKTKWALEILAEEGFKYDSSVYPIAGKRYGWPGFSRNICKIELPSGRSIVEVPMSTVSIFGRSLPATGGGYLRHFPYAFTRWAMRHIQAQRPAVVYMHPHEVDTEDRQFETGHLTSQERKRVVRFHRMQMRNRSGVTKKFLNLLTEFSFTTIENIVK